MCDHYSYKTELVKSINDWTGEEEYEYVTTETSLQIDLDLHRFKCTRCGEIGYYSSAAKAYYEEGVRAPGVQGLE